MKRNMERIVEDTRIAERYCLNSTEMFRLIEYLRTTGDSFGVIQKAFAYGYALGGRAEARKATARRCRK